MTKSLLNIRVNFLVRFASKPLFYCAMTGKPLELFRKFCGAVRTILGPFWLLSINIFADEPLKSLGRKGKHTLKKTRGSLQMMKELSGHHSLFSVHMLFPQVWGAFIHGFFSATRAPNSHNRSYVHYSLLI